MESLKGKKQELNKEISKGIVSWFDRNYSNFKFSAFERLNDMFLDGISIVEISNSKTGEIKFEILDKEEIADKVNQKVNGLETNFENEDEVKNTNFKLYTTDVKENNKTSKELLNIYKENKDKSKDEIVEKLFEHLEKKDIYNQTIEINEKGLEKANNFKETIDLIEKSVGYIDDYFNIYKGSIIKKDGENHYNLNIKDKETKEETNISAKTPNNFKEKVIGYLEDVFEKTDKTNDLKKDILEEMKNTDFNILEIVPDKNLKFEFSNKNRDNGKYSYLLVVENEKDTHLSVALRNNKLTNIAYAITNEKYSDVFDKKFKDYVSESFEKVDYLKQANIEIIEQINENIEKETFKEAKADIILSALEEREIRDFRHPNLSSGEIVAIGIEEKFENRIGNLKDKETFLKRNADELGITVNNETNKINELFSPNETEYKENINQFINAIKENIKDEISEKFELEFSKDSTEKSRKLEENKVVDLIIKEYSSIRPQTLSLQDDFVRNNIPIILSEDKMDLSKNEMKNFYELSEEKMEIFKDKLFQKINDNYNSMSEHTKDLKRNFSFDEIFGNFHSYKFDKFVKETEIKVPKEKKVRIEKDIENKKEKGLEIE